MDSQYCGAFTDSPGEAGSALQIHCELFSHAEERCRSPHSQFLLLGHYYRWKLHGPVGEPHHVLRGQCVCCGDVTATPSCSCSPSERRQLCSRAERDIRLCDEIVPGHDFTPGTFLYMYSGVCMDEGYFQKTRLID